MAPAGLNALSPSLASPSTLTQAFWLLYLFLILGVTAAKL